MPTILDGEKWVAMQFTWDNAGTPTTTSIQLNAADMASPFTDRSVEVATILANAISALGDYTLTRAESAETLRTNLL